MSFFCVKNGGATSKFGVNVSSKSSFFLGREPPTESDQIGGSLLLIPEKVTLLTSESLGHQRKNLVVGSLKWLDAQL